MIVVFAVLVAFAAILGWADYRLFIRNGRVLVRIEELESEKAAKRTDSRLAATEVLPPGSGAMDFALRDTDGLTRILSDWRGTRVLLSFVAPDCVHSQAFMAALRELDVTGKDRPAAVLVSSGTVDDNRRLRATYDLESPVLIQEATEVAYVYHVESTPCGYLVDETGTIISRLARGTENLLALARGELPDPMPDDQPAVSSLLAAMAPPVTMPLAVGTAAPDLSLTTLDGRALSLGAYRGHDVLVVFSDPECAPCSDLAPVLDNIHRSNAGPAVVMVTRGGAEPAQEFAAELGISFPVAFQGGFEISRRFGTLAVPAAILVGPAGKIAAAPAIGVDNIRNLAARASEAFATLRDKEAVPAPA